MIKFQTTEQKRYFIVAVLAVVVLSLVIWTSNGGSLPGKSSQNNNQALSDEQAYAEYLKSIQADPEASKKLFQEVIDQKQLKLDIENQLAINQPVVIPQISDKEVTVAKLQNKNTVEEYLVNEYGVVSQLDGKVLSAQDSLFAEVPDRAILDQLAAESDTLIQQLKSISVPRDAVAYHKAETVIAQQQNKLLADAQNYAINQELSPWPDVYKAYVVIDNQLQVITNEFNKLIGKYELASAPVKVRRFNDGKNLLDTLSELIIKKAQAQTIDPGGIANIACKIYGLFGETPTNKVEAQGVSNGLIKTAQAREPLALILPGTPVSIVSDIPREKQKCKEDFLSSVFGKFTIAFIQNFVKRIDSNYRIANFLYYSDAVAVAQYVPDYLNKYVSNPQDQQLIMQFVRPISCGRSTVDMRPIFRARARQYLGFDPTTLDPNDPDFYTKIAKVGNIQSQVAGQQLNIESIANDAFNAAILALNQEITSSGLKNPRDTGNKDIAITNSAIVKSLQANLQGSLDVGSGKSGESVSSIIVRAVVQIFFNSTVFKGAVIKDQKVCLNTPVFNPVISASTSGSTSGSPVPGSQCDPNDTACISRELLNQ